MQSLRDIIQSTDRHTTAEQQAALDALTRELADRNDSEYTNRNPTSAYIPRPLGNEDYWERQGSTSPASVARERRRDFRPGPRLERGGNNRQRDRLTRISSRSDQLVVPPVPRLPTLEIARGQLTRLDQHGEARSTRDLRYPKRRKLDDGTFDDGQQQQQELPNYGSEGLYKPVNLNMIILDNSDSTDSRSQSYEPSKLNLWSAENKDIYTSKRRKVNILMKHKGGWPFSLSKLVIKMPKHNIDAGPLQGMAFVSMHDQRLVDKTAYYETLEPFSYMFHSPPTPRRYDSYRPSHDYHPPPRSPPLRRPSRPSSIEPQDAQWTDPDMMEEPAEIPSVDGFNISYETITEDDASQSSPRSPRAWHDPDYEYTRRQYLLRRADRAERWQRSQFSEAARRYQAGVGDSDELESVPSDSSSDSEDEDELIYRGVPPAEPQLTQAERAQRGFLDQMRARRERNDRGEGLPRPTQWPLPRGIDPNARSASPDRARRQFPPRTVRPLSPMVEQRPTSTKRLPGCDDMLRGRSANMGSDTDDKEVVPHARFQMPGNGSIAINFEPAV